MKDTSVMHIAIDKLFALSLKLKRSELLILLGDWRIS